MDLPSSGPNVLIVRGTIELARGLGKRSWPRGWKRSRLWNLLVRVGCDTGQGYHWTKPLPPPSGPHGPKRTVDDTGPRPDEEVSPSIRTYERETHPSLAAGNAPDRW